MHQVQSVYISVLSATTITIGADHTTRTQTSPKPAHAPARKVSKGVSQNPLGEVEQVFKALEEDRDDGEDDGVP